MSGADQRATMKELLTEQSWQKSWAKKSSSKDKKKASNKQNWPKKVIFKVESTRKKEEKKLSKE